jgi:hypothetical protein
MAISKYENKLQARDAIMMHLRILGHKNYGITELRLFDPVPMVAYTDNEDDASRLVLEMQGKTSGIYNGKHIDLARLPDHRIDWLIGTAVFDCCNG